MHASIVAMEEILKEGHPGIFTPCSLRTTQKHRAKKGGNDSHIAFRPPLYTTKTTATMQCRVIKRRQRFCYSYSGGHSMIPCLPPSFLSSYSRLSLSPISLIFLNSSFAPSALYTATQLTCAFQCRTLAIRLLDSAK